MKFYRIRIFFHVFRQNDFCQFFLGIFEPDHMKYELERSQDGAGEPSLAELTEKAIQILSKGKQGYFLLVEGIIKSSL